jgi:hypothetical protein
MRRALLALGATLATAAPAAAWEPLDPAVPDSGYYRSTTRIRNITQDAPSGGDGFWVWIQLEDDTTAICTRQPQPPRWFALNAPRESATARSFVFVPFNEAGAERVYTQLLRLQATGSAATFVVDANCQLVALQG